MKRLSLSSARLWLLAAVLFGGPMALHPSLPLVAFDFPSLRIGLYQVLLVGFIISYLPLAPKVWRTVKSVRSLSILLPIALTIVAGLITTLVFARSLLYSLAFMAVLAIAILAGIAIRELNTQQRKLLVKIGLWSGIVFGIVALAQLAIASFDPTALGTLCTGCKASVFGFPRINGLAAEPQFLASALLPTFFLGVIYRKHRRLANWSLLLTSLTILLTFSRGAFAAIVLALLIYIVILLVQKRSLRQLLAPAGIALAGVLIGFALLVTSATLRYSSTPHITYNTTVSMLDQLTLGLVSIPQKALPVETPTHTETDETDDSFTPPGLIEESGEERLDAADLALEAWSTSPWTILFGTGLGNLGSFMQDQQIASVPTDQTVYIFYVLLLSNVGLVGLIPLLIVLGYLLYRLARSLSQPKYHFALLLTLAIAVQFWFFGSFINTVHCFAWIGVFLYNLPKES